MTKTLGEHEGKSEPERASNRINTEENDSRKTDRRAQIQLNQHNMVKNRQHTLDKKDEFFIAIQTKFQPIHRTSSSLPHLSIVRKN
jgi:hypothetical protein